METVMDIIAAQFTGSKTSAKQLATTETYVDKLSLMATAGTFAIYPKGDYTATNAFTNGFILKANNVALDVPYKVDLNDVSFVAASNSNVLSLWAYTGL
jgi:hypothetical protein